MFKILFLLNFIIAQLSVDGLSDAAKVGPLYSVLVGFILILLAGIAILFREYKLLRTELSEEQKNNSKKIDEIRKEISEKDDSRNRQWNESEKETLGVLKGVTSLLEMSEKMGKNDTDNIIKEIKNTEHRIILAVKNKKIIDDGD